MLHSYLSKAIQVWYMDKFWNNDRFYRSHPKEYTYTRIVRFIDKDCRQYKGQNFYKGYPFVYYIKNNLVRCGLIIKGEVFYSSFQLTVEKCTEALIREKMDAIIIQRAQSFMFSLMYNTLIECGAKAQDVHSYDDESIIVKGPNGSAIFNVLDSPSITKIDRIKREIEQLY